MVERKDFLTRTIDDIRLLISVYYEKNPTGGNCHIVLDDFNVADNDLQFCMRECGKDYDWLGEMIMRQLWYFTPHYRKKIIENYLEDTPERLAKLITT